MDRILIMPRSPAGLAYLEGATGSRVQQQQRWPILPPLITIPHSRATLTHSQCAIPITAELLPYASPDLIACLREAHLMNV